MNDVVSMSPPVAVAVCTLILVVGSYTASVLADLSFHIAARQPWNVSRSLAPARKLQLLCRQQIVRTEHDDAVTGVVAPAAYLALAAMALTVVPLSAGTAIADVRTGIVVFGTAEALAIAAIFLRGWSPNSPFPLIAGYRFVAVGLSYELLSMFVLIGAAIPAESLSIGAIVDSQSDLWNVVRQPLGLPLFIIVALGITFSGPLDLVVSADLSGGAAIEDSGMQRLVWSIGRRATMVVFSMTAAAVFLGGWHGPLLPGRSGWCSSRC